MHTPIEYSEIGIQKIAKQAAADVRCVRCPRDSVVMRVLACRVVPVTDPSARSKSLPRLPRSDDWLIKNLDFECPACRRRAMRVPYTPKPRAQAAGAGFR